MAKKNGFDTVRLASERLAGKTWEQQISEHNGNGGHKPENGKPVVDSGAKKEQPVKKDNPETKKVKNQAEIDRVKEQNERVSRERAEIKESVDGSLRLISNALAEPSLSAKDRVRLQWIQKSVEGAKNKIVDGENYSVEVLDNNGKVNAHRLEGLPVDELITVVQRLRTLTEKQVRQAHRTEAGIERSRKVKEKYELASVRANISGEEAKKKMAWFEVLNKLPVKDKLKEEAYKEVEAWEEADRKKAEAEGKVFGGYDEEFKKQQLGEALRQRVEKYLKIDEKKLKAELDARTKTLGKYHNLVKVLSESSLPYFAFHYPKNYKKDGEAVSPLGEGQKREQHLYTEREANLIAKDQEYKAMLLERYIGENKLPQGFDKMDELRQNYELAMLALESRRVLVLPQEQQVPKEELESEVVSTPVIKKTPELTPITTTESTTKIVPEEPPVVTLKPTPAKHKLENTNPPYDWENKLDLIPEKEVPSPEKTDKKLFLIDISAIAQRMAETKAEEKLRKQFDHKGGFFGKVVKNAWKGMTEEHYRLKFYKEALKEIQNDNNLMRAISERVSGTEVPGAGTRVSSEYLEMLDKVVLEYKKDVVDTQREVGDSMNNDPEVKDRFAELLHRYRTNKWDGAAYNGLDKRAAVELFVKENIAGYINRRSAGKWTTNDDRVKEAKGLLYASNFYEILESVDKNYKEQIDAAVKDVMDKNPEASVEAVRDAIAKQVEGVQGLNLQLGLKERDIINNRPKDILNAFERITDSVENHKVLGKIILNPLVMGAAATVTSMGAQRIIKWAAVGAATVATGGSFWIPLGVGSAVGGVYRAIKRGKDTEYDTAQELRQKTLGGKGSDVLGEKGERSYDAVVMSFKEAMAVVASMKDKKTFTDAEKQQLAKIYARLQLERDTLADNKNKFTKVDLFSMDEDQGKRYGSNVSAKADLKIALKELGIKEQDLQSMAEVEKTAIMDVIKQVNEKQGDFKRKEMLVSGIKGAVMGFAGGILAQEAIHLGGEQVEKLWGGSYFKNHHTSFDKIVDGVKGTKLYQSNFDGHPVMAGATAVEHVVTGSRDQTSMEWMKGLKGHIAGGNIEKIHTQNWYDNPTGETPHTHNGNELKFYINKNQSGNFHFKVPVEKDGSWMIHNQEVQEPDLEKAFADGKIKMIFVPDGKNAHDAIVLDVDSKTHEVIIPKDSNIAKLFDPATGRPKGTGFFGLAEATGARSDGSKNYIWINSEKNNGQGIDFGKKDVVQDFMPVKGPVEYDQALPTVLPQRKVFYRPGENEKEENKQKKKAEKEAKQKADKEKKDKEKVDKDAKKKAGDQKAGDKGSSGGNESGGGGGGSQEDGTKKAAGETTEAKAPEFKGDVLKRYLNPQYAAALLELYGQNTGLKKIDKKAIRFVVEGDAHKGKILKPDKATKAERAEAVWQMEQALIAGNIIKQNQVEEFYGDVVEEEVKIEAAAKAAAPKPGAEAPPKPGASETTAKPGSEKLVETKSETAKSTNETGGTEFGTASKELLEKTGKRVHYIMDGKLMPDSDKLKVLKAFDSALDQLPKNIRDGLLNKTNPSHRDTELSKGVLLSFEAGATKPAFEAKNFLRIPPDAQVEDIKKALEDSHKRMLERRAEREAGGGNPKKPAKPVK